MERTPKGYRIVGEKHIKLLALADVVDAAEINGSATECEEELWALVQAQEERIRELERQVEARQQSHAAYIIKAEKVISAQSTRLAGLLSAAKAAHSWIREITEASSLRVIDMAQSEHRRDELLPELQAAIALAEKP
jgi:hypothetical protein